MRSLGIFAAAAAFLVSAPAVAEDVKVGIGIFASARSLPRGIALVGAWYFVAGLGVLMLASDGRALSPWTMGVPFAVGQFLMAAILRLTSGEPDGEI